MAGFTIFQNLKRIMGMVLKGILFFLAIILLGLFSFLYFGTYESGLMAGKVLRISEKGVIFKTYEGKISLDTFGALKGVSPIAETFDFSVNGSDTALIRSLQEVALSGERVNLHFKKRYMKFFWRGDTKYFVTRVERTSETAKP